MRRREFIWFLGSAAAAWPFAARAQLPMPVIGFMSSRSPEDSVLPLEAFRRGLKEGGFVEGTNVEMEFRWARGNYGQLPALAADLVKREVAVIVAAGGEPSALAAKSATATIPIVFGIGSDPVRLGLVESISRPGGNATGVTLLTSFMEPKRLGLLHDLAPDVTLVGVLINPNSPATLLELQHLEEAARASGERIVVARAGSDKELEAELASLIREGAGALLVTADPYFDTRRDRIVAFAQRQGLPAIYQFREYVVAGGLLSYGASITDAYYQYAAYTSKILKGAKPGDLPIAQVRTRHQPADCQDAWRQNFRQSALARGRGDRVVASA